MNTQNIEHLTGAIIIGLCTGMRGWKWYQTALLAVGVHLMIVGLR